MTEDEMVGWHHQLNAHEFEQALGVGNGQGGLACSSPWTPDCLTLCDPMDCSTPGLLVLHHLSELSQTLVH